MQTLTESSSEGCSQTGSLAAGESHCQLHSCVRVQCTTQYNGKQCTVYCIVMYSLRDTVLHTPCMKPVQMKKCAYSVLREERERNRPTGSSVMALWSRFLHRGHKQLATVKSVFSSPHVCTHCDMHRHSDISTHTHTSTHAGTGTGAHTHKYCSATSPIKALSSNFVMPFPASTLQRGTQETR